MRFLSSFYSRLYLAEGDRKPRSVRICASRDISLQSLIKTRMHTIINEDRSVAAEPPRDVHSLEATGEGPISHGNGAEQYDDLDPNPSGRSGYDEQRTTNDRGHRRRLNVATWNVRTLHSCGKLYEVEREFARLKIDVLGLSEVRWTNSGKVDTGGTVFYYKGDEKYHQRGVGFMVNKSVARSVMAVEAISDRLIVMRINSKPQPVTFMQTYMPTCTADDEEVMQVYSAMQEVIDKTSKKDRLVIMGDFNAQIGRETSHAACGLFRYGDINDRGRLLLDWLGDNGLIAVNTCFRHREGRCYTWVSPGGTVRTQIDFIAIRRRDKRE